MPDRDEGKQTLSTAEELKQEFRSHLLATEFGSPDYTASCDFFALENQRHLQRIELKNLMRNLEPEDRLVAESDLRITETRIAILESDIEQKQSTDISYYKSYNHVEAAMEKLREAIYQELESRERATSKQRIRAESEEMYWDIQVHDFRDLLYRFYQ